MVIEWLRFWVQEGHREQFIQNDERIWTQALAKYDGFLGKDVWISHESLTEVITVVHWETEAAWDSITPEELVPVEARFQQAMGEGTYALQESRKYIQRKSSRR